jgi:hypothetical protein
MTLADGGPEMTNAALERLSFREIFLSIPKFLRLARTVFVFILQRKSSGRENPAIAIAA